ncbi:hypothetical protein F5877DRAFT_86401 [Lentinula edodes]|nr:hypothetical protein F5877DRAFT_86401 [Lentinula edodes]
MSDNFEFNVNSQPTATIASLKRKALHPQNGVAHDSSTSSDDGKEYPALKRFKYDSAIEHILPSPNPLETLNTVNQIRHEDSPYDIPVNTTIATHFSEESTTHDDSSCTSQTPDPPTVDSDSDYVLNSRNSLQLDPQEFTFDRGSPNGHGCYQDDEYEGGFVSVDHPNFTEEDEPMESTFDEGVQGARMTHSDPDYLSGYADVGPVVTVNSFSNGSTVSLRQPNYSRDCSQEQLDHSQDVPDGICSPHDDCLPIVGEDTELAADLLQADNYHSRENQEAGHSGYTYPFGPCSDTDTIISCFDPFTEELAASERFKTVEGQVKEQGQVIVDMNGGAVIEEPLEVEAEQGEANSQAKEEQGHQAVPHSNLEPFLPVVPFQVEDGDTERRESGDLGFSLPSQICHENILDSDQQADIPHSPLPLFDTASIEGADKFTPFALVS